MKREYEFRLWDPNVKEMTMPCNFGGISVAQCLYPDGIVMQYTGLKDKNITKIYEGDIVNVLYFGIPCGIPQKNYHIGEIVFLDGCFTIEGAKNWGMSSLRDNIEVIGNIYENPELLEST
jgi:uncharacterized phage protein (TIGR01671 family)